MNTFKSLLPNSWDTWDLKQTICTQNVSWVTWVLDLVTNKKSSNISLISYFKTIDKTLIIFQT